MCAQAESFSRTDLPAVDQILYFLLKRILTHSEEGIPGAKTQKFDPALCLY